MAIKGIKSSKFNSKKHFLALAVATVAGTLGFNRSGTAAPIYWQGATGGDWSTTSNWSSASTGGGTALPGTGDIATFDATNDNNTSTMTVNLNGTNQSIAGMSFLAANTGAFSILGGSAAGTLTLGTSGIAIATGVGSVTLGGTGANAVNVLLNGNQSWANNAANLFTVNSNITNIGNATPFTLTLNGSGTGGTLLAGNISDGGATGKTSLVINTTGGMTTLGASNTYSGGTTLTAGVLGFGNNNALGSGTLTITGGSLDASTAGITLANNPQKWSGNFGFIGTNNLNMGTGAVTDNADVTVTTNAGTLTVGGAIAVTGANLRYSGSGSSVLALTGSVTGGAGLVINSGGTLTLSGTGNTFGSLYLGFTAPGASTTSTLNITGGSTTFNGRMGIGAATGARGLLNLSGGTLTATGDFIMFAGSGATNLTASGVINQTGGVMNVNTSAGVLMPWAGSPAYGAYLLSAGTLNGPNAGWNIVNQGSQYGLFSQSGGAANFINSLQIAGNNQTGQGAIVDVSGGTLTHKTAGSIAFAGSLGVMTVRGSGTISEQTGNFFVANSSNAVGIVNVLSGGTLEVNRIQQNTGTGTVNFEGGTLRAFSTNAGASFFSGVTNALVYTGGVTVDTNSTNVTIAENLSAPSGFGIGAPGSTLTISSGGGTGYIAPPVVLFAAPASGVAATGVAILNSSGTVTGIIITSPGSGYTSSQSVAITFNGGNNAANEAVTIASGFNTTAATSNTSGGLTKINNGILTLSGTNTYGGGTTVSAGTLLISGANALPSTTSLTVAAGATFSLADGTARSTTIAGLSLAGGSYMAFDWNAGSVDTLTTSATAATAGNIGIIINPTNTPTGSGLTLIHAAGGLTGANYFLANNTNFSGSLTLTATDLTISSFSTGTALTTAYWYGNQVAGAPGAMALSNTVSNWSTTSGSLTATGLVPGSTANAIFSATGATQEGSVTLGANMSLNSLTFNDTTPVTINNDGYTLTLLSTSTGASSAISANQNATINAALALGASQTWTVASGVNLAVGGNISGAFGLTSAGTGTLSLTGTNTYTGGTTISAGTVALGSSGALATTGTIAMTGGTLQFSAANTTDYSSRFSTAGSQIWNINTNGQAVAFGSALQGASSLTKLGTGTLSLSAANTYTGGTTVSSGVLQLSGTGTLGSAGSYAGTITIASGASFFDASSVNQTLSGTIAGSGTLTKSGVSTLTLTGPNTFSGANIVSQGTLLLSYAPATNTAYPWLANGITLGNANTGANPVQLTLGAGINTNDTTFSSVGTRDLGTITVGGQGTGTTIDLTSAGTNPHFNLVLNGPVTLKGPKNQSLFHISGTGVAAGSYALTINANGGTQVDTSDGTTSTFTGDVDVFGRWQMQNIAYIANDAAHQNLMIPDTSSVMLEAGSEWVLVHGSETIDGLKGTGMVDFAGGNSIGPQLVVGAGNGTATFNGVIASISFGKVGTGTQTLAGSNTYTGGTFINGGVLSAGIAQNGATWGPFGASGTISFGGGTLQYSSVNNTDYSSRFSNAASQAYSVDTNGQSVTWASNLTSSGGSLAKLGLGTLTITGADTYTGGTTVTNGKLLLSGTGAINGSSGITVNGAGASFVQTSSTASTRAITLTQGSIDGVGTIGNVTVADLAANTIAAGNGGTGNLATGNLTFNGAGTINLSLDSVINAATLTLLGAASTITLNAAKSSWNIGTTGNKLIGYTSFNGTNFSDLTKGTITGLTSRQTVTGFFNNTGSSEIDLTIAGDSPKWTGLDSSNWQVGTTGVNHNWQLVTALTPTDYIEGDNVLFDDSATGTLTVSIAAANVSPTSVLFNNSTKNYTINGPFGIAAGKLSLTGSGTVTLAESNSYTGGTTIANGKLILTGSLASAGGVVLGGGATSGILQLGTGSTAVNQTIAGLTTAGSGTTNAVVGGASAVSILTVAPASAITYGGTLGGAGANQNNLGLVMGGAGTLTLSHANTYTGGTTISSGTLDVNNNTALGGTTTLTLGNANSGSGTPTLLIDTAISTAINIPQIVTTNNGAGNTITLNAGSSLGDNAQALLGTLNLSGTAPLTMRATNTGGHNTAQDFVGTAIGSGIASGTTALTLDGTSQSLRVTWGGTSQTTPNSFTGDVLIKGTVTTQNTTFASTNAAHQNLGFLNNNVTVNSGASWSIVWGGETVQGLNGSGNISLSNQNALNNIGLTIGNNNGSGSYSGAISGATFGVLKIGTGTQSLSGGNGFSGGFTITAGTIIAGNASAFGTGTLTLGGGAITTSGVQTFSNPINVLPSTTTNIFGYNGGSNYPILAGTITGSGTIQNNNAGTFGGGLGNFFISGNISGFTGTFSFNNNASGSDNFQFNGSAAGGNFNGSQAHFVLSGSTSNSVGSLYIAETANATFQMGELSGTGGVVSAGAAGNILQIGALNTSTTYSGLIVNGSIGGATLTLNKVGTGTQTLSGANTYSGGTTVTGGNLLVANTSGSATGTGTVTVASGGTLAGSTAVSQGFISGVVKVQAGGTLAAGNQTAASMLTLSGGLNFASSSIAAFALGTPNGTSNALVNITGGTFTASSTTINLTGSPVAGTYDLFAFTGTLPSLSSFSLGTGLGALSGNLQYGTNQIDLLLYAHGSSSWNGASNTTHNWNDSGNWVSNIVPGLASGTTSTDTATFNAAPTIAGNGTTNPVVVDASRNVGSIAFNSASPYVVGGTGLNNALLLTSGGSISSASGNGNTQTVNAPLVLEGANGTYAFTSNSTSAGNVLNIGGGITGGAAGNTTLTLSGSNTGANTISGVIGDGLASVSVYKDGSGTWILSSPSNTYSGVTTINAGTLQTSNTAALSTGGVVFGSTGTGTLALAAPGIGGSQTYTNTIDASNGGAISVSGALAATVGDLTIGGSDDATNTTLSISSPSASPYSLTTGVLNMYAYSTVNIANSTGGSGQLIVNNGLSGALAGNLTGLNLIKTGSGTLTIAADAASNSLFDGELLYINQGVVQANSTNALGYAGNALAVIISTGGTLSLGGSGSAVNVAALADGSGSGSVLLNGKTLQLGNSYVDGGNTFSGVIADGTATGNLVVDGTGGFIQTLGGQSTYTGTTSITNNGTLRIAIANALPTTTDLSVNGLGSTFDLNSNNQTVHTLNGSGNVNNSGSTATFTVSNGGTFSGAINNAIALNVSGGTLALTGANNYSGGTTIASGAMLLVNGSESGTSSASVSGTLLVGDASNPSASLTSAGVITVNSGGVLGGHGTITGSVNVATGGRVIPGGSVGTLTISGAYTQGVNSSLSYILNSPTAGNYSMINVLGGLLTLGSGVEVDVSGSLAIGTYPLFMYNTGLSGTTSGWTAVGLPVGDTANFSTATSGEVDLTIASGANFGITTSALTLNVLKGAGLLNSTVTVYNNGGDGSATLGLTNGSPLSVTSPASSISGGSSGNGTLTLNTTAFGAGSDTITVSPSSSPITGTTTVGVTYNVGQATADKSNSLTTFGPALTASVSNGSPGNNAYAGLSSESFNTTGSGGLASKGGIATILQGDALTSSGTVSMAWRTPTTSDHAPLFSDVVELAGLGDDTFVLEMTYIPGSLTMTQEEALFLGRELTTEGIQNGVWMNAGSDSLAKLGAWQSGYTTLGEWGQSTTDHYVWAVVKLDVPGESNDFAVIPEPTSLGLLGLGALGLLGRKRRKSRA